MSTPGAKKVRRPASRRLWKRRPFRLGVLFALLGALLIANVFFIIAQSPDRRKHAHQEQGFIAFDEGRFEAAAIHFQRYLGVDDEQPEAWYMLGLCLLRISDSDGAVDAFKEAIRLRPAFSFARIALAEHLRARGDYCGAREQALAAIARPPVRADAWVSLGGVELDLGNRLAAIDAYRKALVKDPGLVEVQLKLGDLQTGLAAQGEEGAAALAEDRYSQAEERARAILRDAPGDAGARIWLARARAGRGFYRDAEEELIQVIEEEPAEPSHRMLLSEFLYRDERYEDAARALKEAWAAAPHPLVAVRWSEILSEKLFDPEGAEDVLAQGIAFYPDHTGLRIALVAHHRRAERFLVAFEVLEEALDRNPSDSYLFAAMGDLLLAAERGNEAQEAYRRSLALDSGNLGARRKLLGLIVPVAVAGLERGDLPDVLRSEVDEHLDYFLEPGRGVNPGDLTVRGWAARMLFAEGDFAGAVALLGEASGSDFEGRLLLGMARMQGGDYYGASEALYEALIHPDCPHRVSDYELAYSMSYRTGRPAREVEIAERAVGRWPEDPEWRLRLATSLFRAGRRLEALGQCQFAKTRLAGAKDVRAYLLAARIHQAGEEWNAARQELENAVLIRRDAETRGALYAFLAAAGDTALAEEGYRAMVAEDPDDPEALLVLGDFLLQLAARAAIDPKRIAELEAEALAQYQRALTLSPDSLQALFRIAEVKMEQASRDASLLPAAEEAVRRIVASSEDAPHNLYFTGKLALLKSDPERAVRDLSKFVREEPEDAAGFYYLGIAYRRSGELEKARDQFLAALGLSPGLTEARLELATLHFTAGIRARWAGDHEQAREYFSRVVAEDPNEPESRRLLSESLAALGLPEQALEEAERLLKLRPDDKGALFLTGLSFARLGQHERAEERFARLAELVPDNFRSFLYLGMVQAEQGRHDDARESLRKAKALARDAPEVLRALVVNELAGGDLDAAIALAEREQESRPDHAFVQLMVGDLYRQAGRTAQAVQAYLTAVDLEPADPNAYGLVAATLADRGEFDRALEILDRGVDRVEAGAGLLGLKGQMLRRRGETQAAEESLRAALLLDPELWTAYLELGAILAETGRAEEGEGLLVRAAEGGLADPVLFFRLARLAAARDDLEAAARRYRQVLALAPDDTAALNNLARVLSEREADRGEAMTLAARARELAPQDPRVADTLGWALYSAGQHEESVVPLLEAARGLPEEPVVQHRAGLACYRTYRWDEALRYLNRAVSLDPEYPGSEEGARVLDELR